MNLKLACVPGKQGDVILFIAHSLKGVNTSRKLGLHYTANYIRYCNMALCNYQIGKVWVFIMYVCVLPVSQ